MQTSPVSCTWCPAFGGMFLQRRKLELADLYEDPLTSFGLNAVDKLFSECDLAELVSLVKRLAD